MATWPLVCYRKNVSEKNSLPMQQRIPFILKGASRWLGLLLFVSATLLACTAPTPTPAPADSADGWTSLATGVEFRVERVTPADSRAFDMHILRVYPAFVQFKVSYRPQSPLSFTDWQAALPDALAFVNANFFDEYDRAIGLVIADGVSYGYSLVDFGGMFQVESLDSMRLRYLVTEPYQGEGYQQAIQSFPMLLSGGQPTRQGDGFNSPARRSAIAQDTSGRIVLFSTGLLGEISFADLQTWLANHPTLAIESALALDGGRSAMLYATNANGSPVTVSSFDTVPVVLGVYAR